MSITDEKEVNRMQKLKTAIIDIGSNTIRLAMYQYDKDEGLHEFDNIKTVARLRTHLLPSGEMSEEGIRTLAETLVSFKQILDDYGVTDIQTVATAAVRQASNNEQIIEKMKEESGIKIRYFIGRGRGLFWFFSRRKFNGYTISGDN